MRCSRRTPSSWSARRTSPGSISDRPSPCGTTPARPGPETPGANLRTIRLLVSDEELADRVATADLGTYINALEASVASYCLDKPVGPTVLLLKVALGAQGPPFELGWDGSEPPEHWGLAMLRRCDDVERPSVSGEVRLLLTFDLTGSGTVQ